MQPIKNNHIARYIFSKMPVFLRKDYVHYLRTKRLIKKTEFLSSSELEKWQFQNLKKIVNYAWDNIEGYQNLWQSNDFNPQKLNKPEDIKLIPFVTKEMLRDNIDKFTNHKLSNLEYITTGGSTGIPFGFYQQYKNNLIEWAFINDLWSRFYKDLKFNSKRVNLRGDKINGTYYYDPIKGLLLSSYDINLENVKEFIKQIERCKYPIFHVYPSAIYLMAKIMKDNNLVMNHKFKSIMFGSEPLYGFQKELINEVFNTKLCYWYGHTEKSILAGNCELDDRFHVYPQYGITEIINGELIGTSFWNYATPFIRYKTTDYAETGVKGCSKCNRTYTTLNKIDGRLQDYIVNKDLELVTLTALIFAQHFDSFSKILQMQLEQKEVGKVIVKIVPTKDFADKDKSEIVDKMLKASHNKIAIEVKLTESIKMTKAGKLKFLDQQLDIKKFI